MGSSWILARPRAPSPGVWSSLHRVWGNSTPPPPRVHKSHLGQGKGKGKGRLPGPVAEARSEASFCLGGPTLSSLSQNPTLLP